MIGFDVVRFRLASDGRVWTAYDRCCHKPSFAIRRAVRLLRLPYLPVIAIKPMTEPDLAGQRLLPKAANGDSRPPTVSRQTDLAVTNPTLLLVASSQEPVSPACQL